MKVKNWHIAESHQRQLNGEDCQKAAVWIAQGLGLDLNNPAELEEYLLLDRAPDPGKNGAVFRVPSRAR